MKKILPHNIEAEQSLLGTLMLYNEKAMPIAIDKALDSEEFYLNVHQNIYKAMYELYSERKPTDITSVQAKLSDLGLLDNIGGIDYLIDLQEAGVTSPNTSRYIEIVQDKAMARRLIETAAMIVEEGYTDNANINELLDEAEKRLMSVTRDRKEAADFKSSKDVAAQVFEKIHELKDSGSGLTGIKTGYQSLDSITNGLQRGDLIILAARPSVGKTAYALNLALKSAKYNPEGAVAIFSLEMGADQLITRMLSADSGVDGSTLKTGQFKNKGEETRLSDSVQRMMKLNLFIDDSSVITTSLIQSKCRKLKLEYGLNMILIDYIQLISGSGKSKESRQQEVSEISRTLKQIARELEVPVIGLSQLSRDVEKRTGNKPKLSDLRESGSIEQDADIVMFLYRPEYHAEETEEQTTQEVEVIVAKNRNGATCTLHMQFEKNINAFTDMLKISQ